MALRAQADRAYVTVCDATPTEALRLLVAGRTWPWMVVGDGAGPGHPLGRSLARVPAVLAWRTPAPEGPTLLRSRLVPAETFAALVAAVVAALGARVSGLCLDVGSGLVTPAGLHVENHALEALVGSHPRPVPLTARQRDAAGRALHAHRVGLRIVSTAGGARLAVA